MGPIKYKYKNTNSMARKNLDDANQVEYDEKRPKILWNREETPCETGKLRVEKFGPDPLN